MLPSTALSDQRHVDLLEPGQQVVLILVGLVASGKSTFAVALESHFPEYFRRCNQDELGNRRHVEDLARRSLHQGLSVCIDRTNFNAEQRSHWVRIAREFPGTSIWVIVFDTPYAICAARLRERTSHPTIRTSDEGLSILRRFASDFRRPTAHEGYDRIITLEPSDHVSPTYSRDDVASIIHRLRAASSWPRAVHTGPTTPYRRGGPRPFGRGYTQGGAVPSHAPLAPRW